MASSNPLPPQRFKNHAVKPLTTAQPVPPTFRRDTFDPVVAPRGKRKPISPGLVLLFGAAVLLVLYASGNLPEADTMWNNAVQSLRSHNDTAVNAILDSGQIILVVALGLFVGLCLLLWRNAVRRRQAEEDAEASSRAK
jgi:hypothetical protein